jgi:hypothetical protein
MMARCVISGGGTSTDSLESESDSGVSLLESSDESSSEESDRDTEERLESCELEEDDNEWYELMDDDLDEGRFADKID